MDKWLVALMLVLTFSMPIRSSAAESKFIYNVEDLFWQMEQCDEALQWLQKRSSLAEKKLRGSLQPAGRDFWSLVYLEATAAQLLVVSRHLKKTEKYGLALQQSLREFSETREFVSGELFVRVRWLQRNFFMKKTKTLVSNSVNASKVIVVNATMETLVKLSEPAKYTQVKSVWRSEKMIEAYHKLDSVFNQIESCNSY